MVPSRLPIVPLLVPVRTGTIFLKNIESIPVVEYRIVYLKEQILTIFFEIRQFWLKFTGTRRPLSIRVEPGTGISQIKSGFPERDRMSKKPDYLSGSSIYLYDLRTILIVWLVAGY
jgi:hypothetical protein